MNTIFVAIASYRDTECQWTIKSLFEQAKYPELIRVGILWQTIPEEDHHTCFIEPYVYPNQVDEVFVHISRANGCGWAKRNALRMHKDEKYTMLIDSHMRFAKDWDEGFIGMLESINNPKSMISTYPAAYEPPDTLISYTAIITEGGFNSSSIPSMSSRIGTMTTPMINPFIAGGFMFAPSSLFIEIPYDPYYYFYGEELSFAIRVYTHGWDIYTPHICLIYHYYYRTESKRQWSDNTTWTTLDTLSVARAKHLMGIEYTTNPNVLYELDTKYGLGTVRTLESYQDWCGYSFADQTTKKGTWIPTE